MYCVCVCVYMRNVTFEKPVVPFVTSVYEILF